MVDIIKCSGGEPLDYTPSVTPGDKVIVITCEEDLNKTSDANAVGVPVCSTELVLGGVLRQEVEIDSYPINNCVWEYIALCICGTALKLVTHLVSVISSFGPFLSSLIAK